MVPSDSAADERLEVCQFLGFASLALVYEAVVAGVKRGPGTLLQRGLNAKALQQLGYTESGLHKLGFSAEALEQLGFQSAKPAAPATPKGPTAIAPVAHSPLADHDNLPVEIRRMINAGARATELRSHGITVQHCRRIGMSATELRDVGFTLEELVPVCSAQELSRAQFNIRELRRFFQGEELRRAGAGADEMRLAGFSVRELMGFGYSDNLIRTAGFSTSELMREGLSRTTRIP